MPPNCGAALHRESGYRPNELNTWRGARTCQTRRTVRIGCHIFQTNSGRYRYGTSPSQTRNISDQLDAGIRFLDLRVAHKNQDDNDHFYFAHGIYSKQTLKDTVTNVAQWLQEHPKEVVIIACSAFDGMNEEEHLELIYFLRRRFEKKLCPKTETPSLSLCWECGYQVILSYDNPAADKYTDFWPKIDYWWANTPDPKDLILFLEGQKESGRPKELFFVAGINLTEDFRYIVQHPCQTMRSMTLRAYNFLLDWVKKQHAGPSKRSLNIICADFVADNEFVHIVIALNKQILS